MKKFFTLIAVALSAMTAQAQASLEFCYEDGSIIPNGSVITVNTPDPERLLDDEIFFESGVFIKNTTGSTVNSTLSFSLTEVTPGSELSVCLGTNCNMYTVPADYSISNVDLAAGSISSMQCHWSPAFDWDTEEYSYGACTGIYTLQAGSTVCSTVTVKFIYADPAGISNVASSSTAVAAYDLQGRPAKAQKGINIVRMSDGTVKKVLNK